MDANTRRDDAHGDDAGQPGFDEEAFGWPSPLLPRAHEVDPSRIAIKYNNAQVPGPCGICGDVAEPLAGVALFMAHSHDPVCDRCGHARAPVLAAMVSLYHAIKAENF